MKNEAIQEVNVSESIPDNERRGPEREQPLDDRNTLDLSNLSNDEISNYAQEFFGKNVVYLEQEEINQRLESLLLEVSKRGVSDFWLYAFSLPNEVSKEEIDSGNSSWAKIYRSIFEISRTEKYKNDIKLKRIVRNLESTIDQNPQMMGPVAMWKIARDYIWRKDIPAERLQSLRGSMTYALAFFNQAEYEPEFLRGLDIENIQNYRETAHMMEAIKYFWSSGHESFAEDTVPDFYLRALRKIESSQDANYLLCMRAKVIISMLEKSDYFPMEAQDTVPFEISKGVYAWNIGGSLRIVPEDKLSGLHSKIKDYEANDRSLELLQYTAEESVTSGGKSVSQNHLREYISKKRVLLKDMSEYCSVPVEDYLSSFSNGSKEEEQELMFDYEYLVSRPIREIIQKEFNFDLKDLTIREQYYFLNYLKKVAVKDAENMKAFVSKYEVNGMRTFLSLERGGHNLGDKIVKFGERDMIAGTIFNYFCELLDSADNAEALVKKVSNCEGEYCTDLAQKVYSNITKRAQKDLESAILENDLSKVVSQINNYVAEAKEYVALLQEVGTGNLETVNSAELNDKDKEQMVRLLRENYGSLYRSPSDANFRETVESSLRDSFNNPNSIFNILRDKDKIVSFNRFDLVKSPFGKEFSYFGSFNAKPAYSGVGGVMLENCIDKKLADGNPIMAHCDPAQPITKKYIESGFVATNLYEVAGKASFEIWRTADIKEVLLSKDKTLEELREIASSNNSIVIRERSKTEYYKEIKEGKALTRFFAQGGITYLVFEELPKALLEVLPVDSSEEAA